MQKTRAYQYGCSKLRRLVVTVSLVSRVYTGSLSRILHWTRQAVGLCYAARCVRLSMVSASIAARCNVKSREG
ncbi:hypothetical protein F4801DRAFT_143991 [Xylaria longipes]|nr:hypothetical protein F4801DRAFT_143991 [Xylaria longipes]